MRFIYLRSAAPVYESNRYSVPLGTYEKSKEVIIEVTDKKRLVIREQTDGPIIADHLISTEKGKLIQATQHMRDRSKGIPAYIATVSEAFEDKETATAFLEEIHQRYPRYVRDQLKMVLKASQSVDQAIRNEALSQCVKLGLYSATEFSDVVAFVQRQHPFVYDQSAVSEEIKTLHDVDPTLLNTKTETRELDRYLSVLKEGATV